MKRLGGFLMLLVGASILFVSTPTIAEIIYDNNGPDLKNAYASDFAYPVPPFGNGVEQGDNFVLMSGSNVITDIHWWGEYDKISPLAQDNFTIRIFQIVSGIPSGNFLYQNNVGNVTRTNTGQKHNVYDVFEYDVNIQASLLTPGDSYLLSIINDSGTIGNYWYWETSNYGGETIFFDHLLFKTGDSLTMSWHLI
jgi:hypothetical protein